MCMHTGRGLIYRNRARTGKMAASSRLPYRQQRIAIKPSFTIVEANWAVSSVVTKRRGEPTQSLRSAIRIDARNQESLLQNVVSRRGLGGEHLEDLAEKVYAYSASSDKWARFVNAKIKTLKILLEAPAKISRFTLTQC